jgi:hypothetical protein
MTLLHSQSGVVDLQIDVAANSHPIDERIYGLAFAGSSTIADLRTPLNRWGGNGTTTHNWEINASNRASDYFFESIADGPITTPGDSADTFVSQALAGGGHALMTIPTIGWVARLGPARGNLASFSVAKYGPQTGSDPFWPDAGNGISATTGAPITGNDPNDAYVASDPVFQQGFVGHLVSRWGGAAAGGVGYYTLDNEPSIWHATHRDVHPTGASMDEVAGYFRNYGAAIKALDSSALIVGPEEWGWSGYFFSGLDQQVGGQDGFSYLPDRAAHGGADYLPYFLGQMQQYEAATGKRLLDIFSVHFYPQGGEYSNDTSTGMQQLRNRSTRALWDPNYVDESWIGTQVQLIPRLKGWAAANYPGTKVGITEYNWGAEGDINGATTLADILGIFGREGLDMASYWTAPDPSTPTYKAFKLYRNYDNRGSGFGDTSVSATAPDPDTLSTFAALRSADGALTIMAINKVPADTPANLHLANFNAGGSAKVWQLTSGNVITQLGDLALSPSDPALTVTLPAQSITLFVIPPVSVVNVSNQVRVTSSGLLYSRASSTFNGTVTVTNTGAGTISGPIQVALTNLTAGVALTNGTGIFTGNPYVTIPAVTSLGPGQSASVPVRFSNPSKVAITFSPVVYSGSIQ